MYPSEPSWQVASSTTSSPDRPDAFTKKKFYYLWDIEPFVSGVGNGLSERWEGSLRPFYLARKYGIRNTVYEERVTTWEGLKKKLLK